MMREPDYQVVVAESGARIYRVRENIYSPFSRESEGQREVLFKRGDRVRIVLENNDDWLRVRALPAQESLEQNPGKVILYLVRSLLVPEGSDEEPPEYISVERFHAELDKLLAPADR
ncbi:MAG: hypothetical protein K1X75_05035 [Leptospirales bacterium]|nr:hypothetical protein [Leptospirales bacterium]